MSDHQAGTGPHPSPQNLNVASGQTVRIQQVLTPAPQNVNVLTTRGQQFVITSHVNVPGLTQVIPTIASSNAGIQQGVTRILNITPSPRVNVVGVSQVPGRTGSVQLANTTSNNASGEVSGRSAVSLVAISQPSAVNAASHPTLVSTLSSPPRQRTTNSLGIMQSSPTLVLASPPTVRSPSNPHGTLSHPAVGLSSVSQVSIPRKRIRLTEMQERPPPTEEIAMARKRVLDHKTSHMSAIREQYAEHTAELFFLQLGGNMMDYFSWRKKPPSAQFLHFLRTNPLDPEDDDEDLTLVLSTSLSAPSVNIEVKPSVTNTVNSAVSSPVPPPAQQVPDPPSISASAGTVATTSATTTSPVKQIKSPLVVRQHPKPHSISTVYDTSLGNQEQIAEKAKQEAYVMQRIVELQKEGLWSEKRLPKVQEPPRAKAHWDYLVEEMVWLAADFAQERKWKKAAAKKCARSIQKYFQEKAIQAQKAEKTQELRLRKIANFIAKEVKTFWTNVEKLVEYKQQTRLEEKRKKVLDQHLSFIVDQTEKYSTWLAESMNKPGADAATPSVPPSVNSSVLSSPARQDGVSDDEFQPNQSSTDDEETIAKEEEEDKDTQGNSDEIEMLKRESELPLEDLLKELPEDYLENRDKIVDKSKSDDEKSSANDDEFVVESDGESSDDEETIQEQEATEGAVDHKEELAVLEAEGEMSLEELLAKYGGPDCLEAETQDDQENETDEKSDTESECDAEDVEGSEMEEDEKSSEEKDDVGLKSLLDDSKTSVSEQNEKNAAADKEISDVAALAESIQPKGNTLSSTNVVTTIPFLLKHTLREYQHIGLDWLVTMFDRKLNGILADEMGLGKTIQTISLLAHLACEKGNWGPHLIIVPTSVMLNWEMEFKKWCPAFKILTYYGTQKERKQKRTGWTKPNAFHVCITSYKLVIQDHQSFRRKKWKYLILDEAQNIKNFKSQRWQLLLNFQTQRRLLLTGTPLQNNLMELWSLMHFLMPNVFQSHREFKEWFSNPVTGMIEGNSEYNDSIIKRLHKVLRPFLLRRLKTEVEKQLPKKYEHIVMCRLSKRQRFLYDDFMSRAKTKETLATGNLLSVINVLMQLRKVCNHPNLFEVRPTVSPFQMEGILYITASLVNSALQYDPFKHVDLSFLNFLLVELETCLTAFVAHRIKKFCVPKPRIEEIDSAPECAPRCPSGKIKIHVHYSHHQQPISSASSLLLNKGLALNIAGSRMASSSMLKTVLPQGLGQGVTLRVTGGNQTQGYSVQLVQQQGGLKAIPVATLGPTQQVPGSTPQQAQPIQNVSKQDGMQRITLPAGFAQLVQTSTGRHILLASPQMVQAGGSQNSPSITTTATTVLTASGQRLTVVPKSSGTVANTPASNGSRMVTTSAVSRPIVRVPPLNVNASSTSISTTCNLVNNNAFTNSSTITTTVTSSTTKTSAALTQPLLTALVTRNVASHLSVTNVNSANVTVKTEADTENTFQKTESGFESTWKKCLQDAGTQSVFYLPELEELKYNRRKDKLSMMAMRNHRRCEACPIYGSDLRESLRVMDSADSVRSQWKSAGYVHCHNALKPFHTSDEFYSHTDNLLGVIHSAEEYVAELKDIFSRFVFCVPAVSAPQPQMHVSHPPPSQLWALKRTQAMLQQELSSKCALLHPIASAMVTQFPDPRLIQYDCGKLQVLDKLLRRLKTDHHRVLIFTQMTRMLDVLEAFLNFHGHIYLRLDGTTRVDQRQILMERFNADKRIFCFILSTRSGGIGVNLTGADTVIFYDSDWNPTMDAQAQDRCHRIGQTRDVHIYRLVSEMTVEENILKKANQKRLLGDLAIEGGNFTTAYFKSTTIQDLFNIDVGENDASRRMAEVLERDGERRRPSDSQLPPSPHEDKLALGALESALAAAEDETDVLAARTAKAEAAADLAEFDENIPLEDGETNGGDPEISRAEQEVNNIMQQLTPVERYAMKFVEETDSAWSAEQLAAAEAEIEQQKREWELGRLQAMKEEEERRSRLEDEEDQLLTFAREDSQNQIWISDNSKEQMPMWCPPTPPQDDNDVYIDHSIGFLYEQTVMSESQLPPVYAKKEHKRLRLDATANDKEGRRLKMRHREDAMYSPRSLFDRQSSAIMKIRRDMKLQKFRGMIRNPLAVPGLKPTLPTKTQPEPDNAPEWLIHEDWALLQAVQVYLELPLNLTMLSPAHTPNWDFVSEIVNNVSRTYRSPKQCRNRYESVIIPWEEGRLLYDVSPKKTKKNKALGKPLQQAKANRPMRTSQLYMQDNNGMYTRLYNQRFETIKSLGNKKQSPAKPAVTNPATRSSKLPALLTEHGINYDTPLTPGEVSQKRTERIAKENQKTMQAKLLEQRRIQQQQQQTKQQQLLQQQLQQQQQQQQAALGGTVQGKAGLSSPQQLPIGSVVTSAAASSSTPQAVVVGINPSQEIVANQVRAVTSSSGSLVTVANLNQAHVQVAAQRLTTVSLPSQTVPVTTPTKAVAGGAVTASKLNVQILRQLQRQQSQLHQQQLQQQQQQQQQQQHRLTPQQQLKVLQAAQASGQGLTAGQKVSVAMTSSAVGGVTAVQVSQAAAQRAQQLMNMKQVAVATAAAAASAGGKQGVSRVTDSDMAAIIKQQQLVAAQRKGQQLQVASQPGLSQAQAHLLAQAGIQMQQAGTSGQTQVATLVKAVSTPGGTTQSVTIPVTGMTLPHMKATLSPGTKSATPQQIRQLALHPQILQQRKLPVQKVAQLTQVAGKAGVPTQLIVQSPKAMPTTVTVQQIQQVMKHVPPVQHITHVSGGQAVVSQPSGSQVISHAVLTKSSQIPGSGQTLQTRVIPMSSNPQGLKQTIQVVTAAPGGRTTVPNVTIDSSGRPTVSVASTLASALAGTIKVSPSAAQQQALLSQVSAALQGQHVQQIRQPGSSPMRIQAVAVQQQGQALPAVITQATNPPQAPNHQENTQ